MSSPQVPQSASKTITAQVALIHIEEVGDQILRDCFRQFGIDCVTVATAEELSRKKIEGCVVDLENHDAGKILESLRKSPSSYRAVVFGLEKHPNTASKFLRYGVSVVLPLPLDRRTVVKAVRSTRALLLNEFRRYVRIPIAVEVLVEFKSGSFLTYTEEISGGGLSFKVPQNTEVPSGLVRVTFALPNSTKLAIDATVCWQKQAEQTAGVRFENNEAGRQSVKKWIDEYLQLT